MRTLIIFSFFIFFITLEAKIFAPAKIEPIDYDGKIISFPHYVKGSKQQGGWVKVVDKKTKKKLCLKKIWKTTYRDGLEMDVQHNFVYRVRRIGNIITVYDSKHNDVYKLFVGDICK